MCKRVVGKIMKMVNESKIGEIAKRIGYIIVIFVMNLIITVACIGYDDIRQNILRPNKMQYTMESIEQNIKDFTFTGPNNLYAESENPWILIALPQTYSLNKIVIKTTSVMQSDSSARIYFDVGEITGNRYVDFRFGSGINEVYFPQGTCASTIRLDLTHIKGNLVGLDSVCIYLDNLVCRQFVALFIGLFFVELLFVIVFVKHSLAWKSLIRSWPVKVMILGTVVLFLVLYGKYIGGDDLYGFKDVGSDTFYGYIPQYITMMDKIRNVDLSVFNLNDGIGNSIMANANIHMELPFIFILCLFGENYIYQGILFCTFLKTLLIVIICFMFLREKGINEKIAAVASLFWGFSGYNVLWGQHSFFLTAMVVFSLLMFFVGKVLNGKGKWWFHFSLLIGLYSINNFYFLYSCLATTGVYFFAEMVRKRNQISFIVKNVLCYFGFAFLGVGIFLPISSEWLICMFESARDMSVTNGELIEFSIPKLCALLGRALSTECFGVLDYSGVGNLYEAPMLATSILLIPACYWFCKKGKCNIIWLGVVIFSCFLPVVSSLFMGLPSNRWYYFYSFLSIVIIAQMLNDLLIARERMSSIDVIICWLTTSVVISILEYGAFAEGVKFDTWTLISKVLFLVLYLLLLSFESLKIRYVFLFVMALAELGVGNYNIVNSRINITADYYDSFVNGYTQELIEEIQSEEKDLLYRIKANNCRDYLSHSAVGRYWGTNSYSSMNKKYAIQFIDALQETDSAYAISKDANHFDISCENYTIQTLLGVKYIISDSSSKPPIGYSHWKTIEDTVAYYNDNSVEMGVVYESAISKEEYSKLSPLQKNLVLFDSYYVGNVSDNEGTRDSWWRELQVTSSYNFDESGIWGCSDDNSKVITIEKEPSDCDVELVIEMTAPATGKFMKVYYAEVGEEFCEDNVLYRYLIQGRRTYSLYIDALNIDRIMIVPVLSDGNGTNDFVIHSMSFVPWTEQYEQMYIQKATDLKEKSVVNASFFQDKYTAFYNNEENEGMLFIPFGYSINWSATVNGEDVEVVRLNDAFCGVPLPQGECHIVMTYKTWGIQAWLLISAVSIIVWFTIFCYYNRREKTW